MLSRIIVSSLALLFLVLVVLAHAATPSAAQATVPLTPPPIAPQPRRIGPNPSQPTATITATISRTVTATTTGVIPGLVVLTPTATASVPLPTSTATPTGAITVTASPGAGGLLTVTATPRPVVVVTATSIFVLPTVTPTPQAITLLPSPTPTRQAAAALPLPTATPTPRTIATDGPVTATPAPVESAAALPAPLVPTSVPLPASYIAEGSFASQTVHDDGTIVEQQGTFDIQQAAAVNAYTANQHYTLRTQRGQGATDEINVYQVDDYIAVNYTGADWMLVRRDQGSNIVRAIQPITDLAVMFPRIINQAEFIGQEEIAGITALRYRISDPQSQGARLIQPLLALTGEIRSLRLEVWIAVPGAYVVAYEFQVELAGARVLDQAGDEVRADQTVTWTYQLTPRVTPEPITWPAGAPEPTRFPVPGFALGEFPMPPDTELLALVGGMPELISAQTPVAIDSFYRIELAAQGWTVTGEEGILTCSKAGTTLRLLIVEDVATAGTRISVLPSD